MPMKAESGSTCAVTVRQARSPTIMRSTPALPRAAKMTKRTNLRPVPRFVNSVNFAARWGEREHSPGSRRGFPWRMGCHDVRMSKHTGGTERADILTLLRHLDLRCVALNMDRHQCVCLSSPVACTRDPGPRPQRPAAATEARLRFSRERGSEVSAWTGAARPSQSSVRWPVRGR